MSSNNSILLTLLGLSTLLFGIQKYNNKNKVVEEFTMNPTTVSVQRMIGDANGFVSVPSQYQSMLSRPGDMRGNVGYNALIRYNMPSDKNMADSGSVQGLSSLNYADMVKTNYASDVFGTKEHYCGPACNQAGCRVNETTPERSSALNLGMGAIKNSNIVEPNFSQSNFSQELSSLGFEQTTDMLPVSGFGSSPVDALGQIGGNQPIVYDRYIYANQRSRLFAAGDPIRGDLAIVPEQRCWFSPAVNPNVDLRDGALMAVAGPNNDTSKELAALRSASSGGILDVGSGVNYAVQKSGYLGAGRQDLKYSSFP